MLFMSLPCRKNTEQETPITGIAKRDFLAAGLGLGAGLAFAEGALAQNCQPKELPRRTARTVNLFKSPDMYPNALAVMTDGPGGLWVAQQKVKGIQAERSHAPEQPGLEEVWLLDWNGKLQKTLTGGSQVTSGLAYGNGCVWVVANNEADFPPPVTGVWQVDMNNRTRSVHQIPLGGGGSHGAQWHDGKLWIIASRLPAMLRIDPKTFVPDLAIPIVRDDQDMSNSHDMTFDDDGFIWLVTGNRGRGRHFLIKYDPRTGKPVEMIALTEDSAEPHGLVWYKGAFYGCDAGHPNHQSPTGGWIFRIDLV